MVAGFVLATMTSIRSAEAAEVIDGTLFIYNGDIITDLSPFTGYDAIVVEAGGSLRDFPGSGIDLTLSGSGPAFRFPGAGALAPNSITIDGDARIDGPGSTGNLIETDISGAGNLTLTGRIDFRDGRLSVTSDVIITGTALNFFVQGNSFTGIGGDVITDRTIQTVASSTVIPNDFIIQGGTVRSAAANVNQFYVLGGTLHLEAGSTSHQSGDVAIIRERSGSDPSDIVKTTSGSFTISSPVTLEGDTRIEAGTLSLGANGDLPDTPSIHVYSDATFNVSAHTDEEEGGSWLLRDGQTLRGAGLVIGNVELESGATLSPGGNEGGVGTLEIEGDLDLSAIAAGALKFALGSESSHDRVDVSEGEINVAGLQFSHFDFTTLSGFGVGTYTLFSGDTTGSLGAEVSGSIGEYTGTIALGNSVTLTVIPEPGSLLLLAGGLLSVLLVRHRSRR